MHVSKIRYSNNRGLDSFTSRLFLSSLSLVSFPHHHGHPNPSPTPNNRVGTYVLRKRLLLRPERRLVLLKCRDTGDQPLPLLHKDRRYVVRDAIGPSPLAPRLTLPCRGGEGRGGYVLPVSVHGHTPSNRRFSCPTCPTARHRTARRRGALRGAARTVALIVVLDVVLVLVLCEDEEGLLELVELDTIVTCGRETVRSAGVK